MNVIISFLFVVIVLFIALFIYLFSSTHSTDESSSHQSSYTPSPKRSNPSTHATSSNLYEFINPNKKPICFSIPSSASLTQYCEYKVKGKSPETKYTRTRKVVAPKYASQSDIASRAGLEAPYEVSLVPPHLPSIKQQDYARDLGFQLPANCTMEDATCLLSKRLGEDSCDQIRPGLLEFAALNGICLSAYSGTLMALYSIKQQLVKSDSLTSIAFFSYIVYCATTNIRIDNMYSSPYKDVFFSFAELHVSDEEILDIIKNYTVRHFKHLITKGSVDRRNKRHSTFFDLIHNYLQQNIPGYK